MIDEYLLHAAQAAIDANEYNIKLKVRIPQS